ncbi:PTS sugar transporter subunit IIB [Desulfobaculum bizertense]|uniref:PTS system, mannose-specific IIB component n=1 Tax=Desulfobaculum bizertense DSM 18034 TaxID=1121442 RepID=A0A1T4W3I3_9BACT|nr:PTS sugar transporter subunit IIB [Desulfobaculum bizertense]UIJ38762.1 PTS sugar transporter subunit IIB [Desulfobaculum bizertense]SKA71864.1 PTS system, mannose-specific IIB component [Desulfobaculum bizertense DSM 18034]
MFWVRVDNRLVHGQIIETWLPFTKSRWLLVANDALASDDLRQEIMGLAIPHGIETRFVAVEGLPNLVRELFGTEAEPDALILFANCEDARRAHEHGLGMATLNLGNLHYGPGKEQLCAHVALSDEDCQCLGYFASSGVELDFRCIPSEPVQVRRTW